MVKASVCKIRSHKIYYSIVGDHLPSFVVLYSCFVVLYSCFLTHPETNRISMNDDIRRPNNIQYFVGVDAGASSSQAVSLLLDGRVALHGTDGATNPYVSGIVKSADLLSSLINTVLLEGPPLEVFVSMSGADLASFRSQFATMLRERLMLPIYTRITVTHDLVGPLGYALVQLTIDNSNSSDKQDICEDVKSCMVVISGTGSVAGLFSISYQPCNEGDNAICYSGPKLTIRMEKRSGGRGPLLGEQGSAYHIAISIVSEALHIVDSEGMAMREWAQLFTNHAESEMIAFAGKALVSCCEWFGIKERVAEDAANALVKKVHQQSTTRGEIASLAVPLAKLASKGNALCIIGFSKAAESLGDLTQSVLRKRVGNDRKRRSADVLLATGGVFSAQNFGVDFRGMFNKAVSKLKADGTRVNIVEGGKRVQGKVGHEALSCAQLAALAHGHRIHIRSA